MDPTCNYLRTLCSCRYSEHSLHGRHSKGKGMGISGASRAQIPFSIAIAKSKKQGKENLVTR